NIQGTVYVQFPIEKDGSVSNVKAVRGQDCGGGLAEEAVREVSNMPAWTPGEQNGQKVKVSYTLPIFARLLQYFLRSTSFVECSILKSFSKNRPTSDFC